jgi:hypothetical protein
MSLTDLAVVVLAGIVGFGIVSWVINVFRQQRAPPVEISSDPHAAPEAARPTPSLAELGRTWHRTLGVPENADREEIEAAYRALATECDRVSSSAEAPAGERQRAAERRAQVNEAFEFIRTLRR